MAPTFTRSEVEGLSAEPNGQLDPQPLAVQSAGVLIGSPWFIAGKLPRSFGQMARLCLSAFGGTGFRVLSIADEPKAAFVADQDVVRLPSLERFGRQG